MQGGIPYILLGCLALALLIAAVLDLRERRIPNWLNLLIALGAIPYWWSVDLALWPDIAIQLALAGGVFALFAAAFAVGAMGGGDVKMVTAVALWLPAGGVIQLLIIMSLAGGALTLAMLIRQRMRKLGGQIEVPYGVAIAFAGMWLIGQPILNQFGR